MPPVLRGSVISSMVICMTFVVTLQSQTAKKGLPSDDSASVRSTRALSRRLARQRRKWGPFHVRQRYGAHASTRKARPKFASSLLKRFRRTESTKWLLPQ
jgi:hypothetical protein